MTIKGGTFKKMSNTLLVGKNLSFAQAMRVAEGMSYKHNTVVIKSRGKQVQRAIEIAVMLQTRGRGKVRETDIGSVDMDGVRVPYMTMTLGADGVASDAESTE